MTITQDWLANADDKRSQVILMAFRIVHSLGSASRTVRFFARPIAILYRVLVVWVLGVEIPAQTKIGKNFRIYHAQSIVINSGTVIGDNVAIRHGVTIGGRRGPDDCPLIGNGVDIGASAIILGRITVGDNARIGAGAVVIHDVPANASVAGNPATLIA